MQYQVNWYHLGYFDKNATCPTCDPQIRAPCMNFAPPVIRDKWVTAGVRINATSVEFYSCLTDEPGSCTSGTDGGPAKVQSFHNEDVFGYGWDKMHGWVPTISSWRMEFPT